MGYKLIFVLVDALKSLYLQQDTMPFLYDASQRGRYIKQIIASPGFCERSELFSGLNCFETGNFTALGYLPEFSPYKHHKLLIVFFDVISSISPRYAKYAFNRVRKKKGIRLNNYLIPFKSLPNFALTEDGQQQLVKYNLLYDSLRKSGKTYTEGYFTSLSDLSRRSNEPIESFVKNCIESQIDFIPLYIGTIDSMGHKYGSDIISMKPYLKDVDDTLKRLYELSEARGYRFAVLGDHGMVPVTKKLDLQSAVKELHLKLHNQFEMFLDSNMARFWFFDDVAKTKITSLLQGEFAADGTLIDESNYQQYNIPMDIKSETEKPVYGDLLWCANPGVLISPDYFHRKNASENGMHGYLKTDMTHGTGQFIAVGNGVNNKVTNEAHLKSICGELCDLLQISKPNSEGWKRTIK